MGVLSVMIAVNRVLLYLLPMLPWKIQNLAEMCSLK